MLRKFNLNLNLNLKLLHQGLICCGLFLSLSACTTSSTLSPQPTETQRKTPDKILGNSPLFEAKFEAKQVNDKGGYYCSNGSTAFGPITQRMIQKCIDWGGGSSCQNNQWSETLFLKAYGNGRCPDGSRFNSITGYCVEGNNAIGPFPNQLVTACQTADGGNSCQSNRWNSNFLYKLLRNEGLITPPEVPPQFVLLAFDGSSSLEAWNKSRNFAKTLEQKGINLRFTYFISAVYFVNTENRKLYNAPAGNGLGRSAIGWGGEVDDVKKRLEQVNLAYQEGHEIASHAVGHFYGYNWSEADWKKEFDYFDQFIFNAYKINGLTGHLVFDRSAIEGFRAPQLATSPGLFRTLEKEGFRYDTSLTSQPNYWPQKQNGVWNFPLVTIPTALTKKSVLSMDYNFYYLHSKAKPNPSQAKYYEEDMFKSYMNYFESNYQGNRAPIHIGHHLSVWNNGAYWNALFRFAEAVCGQPDVKCVTYRELADFMDMLTPSQIAAYQNGVFPKVVADNPAEKNQVSVREIKPEFCQFSETVGKQTFTPISRLNNVVLD
ncbi:MAG: hypothetical protein VKK42_06150 [Lyngbya sp.]|nr:hypothetical protein [Lyngbya sp.]